MFYMPVPIPAKRSTRRTGTRRSSRTRSPATLVHEFQHLINAGRRIYVNNSPVSETVWLNEGLSHMAEELLYYRVSGNSPRTNISGTTIHSSPAQLDAYQRYMSDGNIERLGTYLQAPEINSPYSDYDGLETRGAIWELLRYAADRKGGSEPAIWRALVNSTLSGQANFNAVFGSITDMTRDWAVAQFTDDAGFPVASQYTYPSWNFRSVFSVDDNFGAWPLATATHALPSGTPIMVTLAGGGASYFRFRVAGDVLASVTATTSGAGVPAAVVMILVRTQ